MASNSYYHNDYTHPQRQPSYSTTTSTYHDHDNSRNDAPLPPLPYNSSHSPSPSPFVDPYGQPSSNPSRYDTDPYDDQHAIPLNDNQRKHGSMHSVAPILPPQHPDDDPFVRDAKPGKKRRRTGDGRGVEEDEGWFKGKITWCCFFFSVVQLIVLLVEIIKYGMLTGTPIQLKPSFNPMIGPSPYLYINMGARYQPCMHNMDGVQNAKQLPLNWPCPNTTSTDPADTQCTLSQLCGFGGVPDIHFDLADGEKLPNSPAPNQWWRFIVPIFLHGGIIHIAFNLLLQLTLGRDVEKLIGSIRFFIVYMAAGIFGFVLGGNFAATGIASTGASGSLFGILAITLLDLLYNWSTRPSPGKELLFIAIDIIIAFVLGLLPGLDNFSHIGGFLMGLVLGVCILRSPTAISRRTESPSSNYNRTKYSTAKESLQTFVKQPLAFFQDRRSVWWVWWAVRAAAALGALIGFILLLKNFYVWRTGCSWCKHLSCLPIKTGGSDWCSIGNLQFSNSTGKA